MEYNPSMIEILLPALVLGRGRLEGIFVEPQPTYSGRRKRYRSPNSTRKNTYNPRVHIQSLKASRRNV